MNLYNRSLLWVKTKQKKGFSLLNNIKKKANEYCSTKQTWASNDAIFFAIESLGRNLEKGVLMIDSVTTSAILDKKNSLDKNIILSYLFNGSYGTILPSDIPIGISNKQVNSFYKAIIFLFNHGANHWSILVYYPQSNEDKNIMYHYDSIAGYGLNNTVAFITILSDFGIIEKGFSVVELSNREKFPKQPKYYSCGWYSLSFALKIIDHIQNSPEPVLDDTINKNTLNMKEVENLTSRIPIFIDKLKEVMDSTTNISNTKYNVKKDIKSLYELQYLIENNENDNKYEIYNYLLKLLKFKYNKNSTANFRIESDLLAFGGVKLVVNNKEYLINNSKEGFLGKITIYRKGKSLETTKTLEKDELIIIPSGPQILIVKPEQEQEAIAISSIFLKALYILQRNTLVIDDNDKSFLELTDKKVMGVGGSLIIPLLIHKYLGSLIVLDETYAYLFNVLIQKNEASELYLYNTFKSTNNNNDDDDDDVDIDDDDNLEIVNEKEETKKRVFDNLKLFSTTIKNNLNYITINLYHVLQRGGKITLNGKILTYNDIVFLSSLGTNILYSIQPNMTITISSISNNDMRLITDQSEWVKYKPVKIYPNISHNLMKNIEEYINPSKPKEFNILSTLKPKVPWQFKFEELKKKNMLSKVETVFIDEILSINVSELSKIMELMKQYPFIFLIDQFKMNYNIVDMFNDTNMLYHIIEYLLTLLRKFISIDIKSLKNISKDADNRKYHEILMKLIQIYVIHFRALPPKMLLFPVFIKGNNNKINSLINISTLYKLLEISETQKFSAIDKKELSSKIEPAQMNRDTRYITIDIRSLSNKNQEAFFEDIFSPFLYGHYSMNQYLRYTQIDNRYSKKKLWDRFISLRNLGF